MIVDASALIAIVVREPAALELAEKIRCTDVKGIGTPTLVETGIILRAKIGEEARMVLFDLVTRFDLHPIPFGELHWREAFAASLRFGKGRHAAALNFGDCMTYATAKLSGHPLLCTGDDFRQTDLVLA
ncbi:MAG: type II toxin-antitoxin system VapC family toxin [Actinomycetota bacterium]